MIKYIYITIAVLIVSLVGCSKEEIATYDRGDSALYFNYLVQEGSSMRYDSTFFSFFYSNDDSKVHIMSIQINTMGKVVDYDRPIAVKQLNVGEKNAAVAGLHYVAFSDAELQQDMVVKAGSNVTYLPVMLKYDPSLDLQSVDLKIGIVENEHFSAGVDEYSSFKVVFTAKAEKPGNWDTAWAGIFGPTWGSVKMKFIIDVTGITDWTVPPASGYEKFYKKKCATAFIEYNKANPDNPMREADGTIVELL